MSRSLLSVLAAISLSACVTTVPDNPDGSGRQIGATRQFILPSGDRLNVTRQGNQAVVLYPNDYPLTDAEAVSYIEDGTGCRPGALLDSFSTQFNGAINRTYALSCG